MGNQKRIRNSAILGDSERSGEASKIALAAAPQRRLDPEVPARATRRRFTKKYKLKILQQADECRAGELGALLRREGLYSSNLQRWRRQREEGGLEGLTPKRRGRKAEPVNPLQGEVRRLERENRGLERKLRRAELMLDIQKKTSELLGIALETPEDEAK